MLIGLSKDPETVSAEGPIIITEKLWLLLICILCNLDKIYNPISIFSIE